MLLRLPTSLLGLLLAGAISACGSGSEPILIGVSGPFSQPRGVSMRLAAELAVDEINRRGGVDGRPLELVVIDDSASADGAVAAAQQFYSDPRVVAVIGDLTSGATLAAAPVYNGGSTPLTQITPSASSPQVSNAGPYTFRACPSDLVHGTGLADWARHEMEADRVAVLYHNDPYGRDLRMAFARRFRQLGGTIVSADPYLPATETVAPYLLRLAGSNADAVMIAGNRAEAERILVEMDSLGITLPVLGADGLSGTVVPDDFDAPVYMSLAYLPTRPDPRNRGFVAAYDSAYDGAVPDHRGAAAYDIVHMLARTIEAVGPDRQAIRDYLATLGTESEPFAGVTGVLSFDKNGDPPQRTVEIVQISTTRGES